MLRSNIIECLGNNSILTNLQHDFSKHQSCGRQLIITVNDFANLISHGEQIGSAPLDFSKAFDQVCHWEPITKTGALWYKRKKPSMNLEMSGE